MGEIGESLGFTDNCHFSSTFKKYIGITPTQYRRNFQSEKKKPH
ncbi:MAG: helix-turn-helix transcriptional regulator [Butyricicoccus sp.]|nr:helix-turn-helix transcriptional regulator [Butyricicoccus sp.]